MKFWSNSDVPTPGAAIPELRLLAAVLQRAIHDFIGGEALILLTEWLDNPAISLLLEDLRSRQKILQQQFPQLVGHL